MNFKLAIIGGGAAGFFAAINAAEMSPAIEVHVFEKAAQFLSKVRVSGGGRCNVTHACFNPKELIQFYPRGSRELLGPFYVFNPADTIEWFEKRRVKIHAEADGRMFPVTNTSQTIIDCFLQEAEHHNVQLHTQIGLTGITKLDNQQWQLNFNHGGDFIADAVIFASGSSMPIWEILKQLGHTIITPLPSLFTFHIKDKRIDELMGVSVPDVICKIDGEKISSTGPLLITHWGLSGPAILKLSAWAAVQLAAKQYQFTLKINFLPEHNYQSCLELLISQKIASPKKHIQLYPIGAVPSRLWKSICLYCGIHDKINWSDASKDMLQKLADSLTQAAFKVTGKSTFKEEFVTCGGVALEEVDLRTMQSKKLPGIYFAGEVLNIDAVTGGFNFQAAWTTAYIAASSITNGFESKK
ncbi:MAG TPA: NAD(P)/FAD-dependent oxidoreductase [Chitinophagales bacterium]|nr:NAD(P)/FAD-dependent oxidoreductase [Chitinophagales bacterium]